MLSKINFDYKWHPNNCVKKNKKVTLIGVFFRPAAFVPYTRPKLADDNNENDDNQNSTKFNLIHKNSPYYNHIYQYSPKFNLIHKNSPYYNHIHQYSPKFNQINQNSSKFTQLSQPNINISIPNAPKLDIIGQNLPKFTNFT